MVSLDLTTMKNEIMETSEKNVDGFDERAKLGDSVQFNKKVYAEPSLKSLGRLSTVTLAGSPGIDDSSCPNGETCGGLQ